MAKPLSSFRRKLRKLALLAMHPSIIIWIFHYLVAWTINIGVIPLFGYLSLKIETGLWNVCGSLARTLKRVANKGVVKLCQLHQSHGSHMLLYYAFLE
jgi:hypothetical protein